MILRLYREGDFEQVASLFELDGGPRRRRQRPAARGAAQVLHRADDWLLDTESFDPSLWFLAWDGSEIAGVSICRVRSGIGWVGIHAVRRPWRRRDLGRALLQHSFVELHRRGYDRVGLGVDAESLTGANRLYESAGLQVVRPLDIVEKRLG